MKMTKKMVWWVSLFGTTFLGILFFLSSTSCYQNETCHRVFEKIPDSSVLKLIFIFPALLLLSLITFPMRGETFTAWWKFARWWILVIFLVTYLMRDYDGGRGYIGDLGFGLMIMGLPYAILIVGSLYRITKAYRQVHQSGTYPEYRKFKKYWK